jgi:hypothetical protein
MVLSREQILQIADPVRVWQVRRFCQVRFGSAQQGSLAGASLRSISSCDAALTALLRCLLYEIDADLAAVSLLDEQTQHFLSVVHAASTENPTVKRTDWFGCENIFFKGGICENTITHDYGSQCHQVYEIRNLHATEETRSLPIVDGNLASFEYYAGAPLKTKKGLNVGALFIFRKHSPRPLSATQRQILSETAQYAVEHLTQTIGAIENTRTLAATASISSLPDYDNLKMASHVANVIDLNGSADRLLSELYETANHLLLRTLGLDNVVIQNISHDADQTSAHVTASRKSILAECCDSSGAPFTPVPTEIVEQLLQAYPEGVVLQLASTDEGGLFIPCGREDSIPEARIHLKLCGLYPDMQQCIFMPLRDHFHDRHTAIIFGWSRSFSRVYSGTADLPSVSSFGDALMIRVRRLEALDLARKKSDFLGSVSHEMRSPLHGILGCIEHLRATTCSPQQLELLDSAAACGLQLNNNIDNILQISRIGNPDPTSSTLAESLSGSRASTENPAYLDRSRPEMGSILHRLTDLVEETLRLHNCVALPLQSTYQNDRLSWMESTERTLVTFDAAIDDDFSILHGPELIVIVRNLSVSHPVYHQCLVDPS